MIAFANDDHPGTIQGVLFDMDGTLSDTEAFWQEAEELITTRYGTGAVKGSGGQQVGAPMEARAAFLRERYGVRLSIPEIQRLTVEHVLSRIREGFAWRPGACELLAEAKRLDIPTALVTSSPRVVAQAVVEALPEGSFDVLVVDEDVTCNKPDPEPYLAAAKRLGVDPLRCIAIEDSLNGTLSAQRAGCLVIAVPNHVSIDEAARRIVLPTLTGISLQRLAPIGTT
jgi:HAD superfamily hydrolase (TIGR01509 family)